MSLIENIYFLSQQQPWFWYTLLILLSAIIGSFATVLTHRLPIMLKWQNNSKNYPSINLFHPRSHCLKCKKTIRWWQNIPLLSYLFLKGKCHHCQTKIPLNYLIIELTYILTTLTLIILINDSITLLSYLIFTWIAITLIIFDLKYLLLPDPINYALLWSGLIISVYNNNAATAIISAVIGYTLFWLINTLYKLIAKKDGIGQGDFKLLAAIGAWFGWFSLPNIILLGSVLGILYALIQKIQKSKPLNEAIPFAPWLLLSSWILILWQYL